MDDKEKPTILYVEDNAGYREIMWGKLERAGFRNCSIYGPAPEHLRPIPDDKLPPIKSAFGST